MRSTSEWGSISLSVLVWGLLVLGRRPHHRRRFCNVSLHAAVSRRPPSLAFCVSSSSPERAPQLPGWSQVFTISKSQRQKTTDPAFSSLDKTIVTWNTARRAMGRTLISPVFDSASDLLKTIKESKINKPDYLGLECSCVVSVGPRAGDGPNPRSSHPACTRCD